MGFRNSLDLPPNFWLLQFEGRNPGIMPARHLENLMRSVLERKHPPADEGPDQVIRLDLLSLHGFGNCRGVISDIGDI